MAQQATSTALQIPLVDPSTGRLNWTWLKLLQQWQKQLAGGFDANGNLIGIINGNVSIAGHDGTLGAVIQHLSPTGVVLPDGMTAATTSAQGAVILPAGATSNTLGTAAIQPAEAFDAAGTAAAAQGTAQGYADNAAGAAQANAEDFARNASNINQGTLDPQRLVGFSGTVTTAPLTTGGTNGSMTFQNGLLTAQVQAT